MTAAIIPVTLLTGFLGSGKTTLLSRALRSAEFSRTAVIINEFGEIGLDHELVAASDEQFVSLTTGCLCCKVQSDLVVTLEDLLARREAASIMPFERVVIETSGLADPAPILHALMTAPNLVGRLAIDAVVTTVDAVNGESTLAREPISVKQAAVADRLIITKTDMTGGAPALLTAALDAINAHAPRVVAISGTSTAPPLSPSTALERGEGWGEGWQQSGEGRQHTQIERVTSLHPAPLPLEQQATGRGDEVASHLSGISTFTVVRDTPLAAVTLTLFLEALAEHAGADLLRLKGLVAIAEAPDRPAVVHGVQHVFHPLEWLDRWPSADRRTRMVFITRAIPRGWAEALLAAIETEVAAMGSDPRV